MLQTLSIASRVLPIWEKQVLCMEKQDGDGKEIQKADLVARKYIINSA